MLGRSIGGDASIIDGQLRLVGAEASLFLINPVGVLFGPGARLNLPGNLTATTASGVGFNQGVFSAVGPVDPALLSGVPQGLLFQDAGGAIVNGGTLPLGSGRTLMLAGGSVVNTGSIVVPGGEIAISAVPTGNRLRLTPTGSLLSYDIAASPGSVDARLTPLSLPELLTGQALGDISVQGDTVADASVEVAQVAIPTEVGTVIVNGVLDVSNPDGRGGTLTITGDTSGVIGALLTAAGQSGGEIYVGGSYLGQGPLPNAQLTYTDGESVLDASADLSGEEGQVIVWSEQPPRSYGQIADRGGSAGGNGGVVETSSRGFLDVGNAVPDITAPAGTAGTWLLDPGNIEIVVSPGPGLPLPAPFIPSGNNAILLTSTLGTALDGGGTVVVSTVGAPGTQAGNITVSDQILYNGFAPATLELRAEGSIFINNDIVPATAPLNPLPVRLIADGGNNGVGQVVVGTGAPLAINTSGGNLEIVANSSNLITPDPSAIRVLNDASLSTLGGDITLNGTGGNRPGVNVELNSNLNSGGGNISFLGTSNNATGVLVNGTVTTNSGRLTLSGSSDRATTFGILGC